jgi:DNA-binding IclR family transcriptional regulator
MENPEQGKDRDFVTALARGLQVLQCFTSERPELGTSEIARLTGLAQSTVWRLCHTLLEMGFLVPGNHPERLRAGVNVLTLGGASVMRAGIASAAYPHMLEMAREFGAHLSLAARSGTQMIIVQRAEPPHPLQLNFTVGTILPMEQSSVGSAYLAATSATERDQLMRQLEQKISPAAWSVAREFLDEGLATYQAHGYVLNRGQLRPDIWAVAVPLIAPDGRTIMALNCGGPRSSMPIERLAGPIARALFDVTAQLRVLL